MEPTSPSKQRRAERLPEPILWGVPTALLALVTTSAILSKTGGIPSVPLDDSFIHFEFARSFARLAPLAYGTSTQPVAGATSLLWPLMLAPFHWLGLEGLNIIWPAWLLGWVSLGLLARETHRGALGLLGPQAAAAAGAMVLAFGGYVWFAASGMEVILFSWLLMRAARQAAEWAERRAEFVGAREHWQLVATAWLLPGARPEGAIFTVLLGVVQLCHPRGRTRAWSLLTLSGALGPVLVTRLLTGRWTTTTAEVKWLLFNPYPAHIRATLPYQVELLFSTLLDGRVWSALFVPQGSRLVSWAAPVALLLAGWRTRLGWRATSLLLVALGMLVTTSYDSFLVNRLRYLWPFSAAWFIGLGALAEEVGLWLGRWQARLRSAPGLLAWAFVGALASHLSLAIEDVSTSADAIRRQQVDLALWAREHLPPQSRIGINDAGALVYLSRLPSFDVVGLTTEGEGRYWVSGPGSRFEHYERLGPERLPTHFIVYPRWFAIPALLGERLTERSVEGATILGDVTKVVYRARYEALGSAELPLRAEARAGVVDRLDVADLESEAVHSYELFSATQFENAVFEDQAGHVDGGRSNRSWEEFWLELVPKGRLVARLVAEAPMIVALYVDGTLLDYIVLLGDGSWEERVVTLDPQVAPGRHRIRLRAPAPWTFAALHYWCLK